MIISVNAEGGIYVDCSLKLFTPLCVAGISALGMSFMISDCSLMAGALGYNQVPFEINNLIVIARVSIIMKWE